MTKYVKQAINNPLFQYLVYSLAGIHVFYMLISYNFSYFGVFAFTAIYMLICRKNIVLTLIIAMVISNIYFWTYYKPEGFKGKGKSKGIGGSSVKKKSSAPAPAPAPAEDPITDSAPAADTSTASAPAEDPSTGADPAATETTTQSNESLDEMKEQIELIAKGMKFVKKQLKG